MIYSTPWEHAGTVAVLWLALVLILSGSLVLAPFARAEEKETITWSIIDLPPFHFVAGPNAGNGPADKLMHLMQDRLPQYNHQIEIFPNLIRSTERLEQGACMCGSIYWYCPPGHPIRNQRAYSMPTALSLESHLVIRQRDRHLFGEIVSFEELLHNQELIFGHPAGRAYSPRLDAVLNAYLGVESYLTFSPKRQMDVFLPKSNIYVRTGDDVGVGLMKMLVTGRIDYLVSFPFITAYLTEQGIEIAIIPIAELRDTPPLMTAFACSPTETGRQVIEAINAILKNERNTPEYRMMIEPFVVPKEREEEYWKLYDEQLLTVFK